MNALKGMIVVIISIAACVILLTSFSGNMQAAYNSETTSQPYTWDHFKASLGIGLGDKKLTELTMDDFTPEAQAQITEYGEGKSLQMMVDDFCGSYGTPEYDGMQDSLSNSNPGKDFTFFFAMMDMIAPFCQ